MIQNKEISEALEVLGVKKEDFKFLIGAIKKKEQAIENESSITIEKLEKEHKALVLKHKKYIKAAKTKAIEKTAKKVIEYFEISTTIVNKKETCESSCEDFTKNTNAEHSNINDDNNKSNKQVGQPNG